MIDSHIEESPDNQWQWSTESHDDPDDSILMRIDDFFQKHFPNVFQSSQASEVLLWKIKENNPFGRGHLTVATTELGEVVGIASAAPRQIKLHGRILNAVEVGDTFTAPFFRTNGRHRDNGVGSPPSNFEIDPEYLTKSVFGRLMYETLSRARESGFELAYGFPNEFSLRPYLRRFKFNESNGGELYSFYLLGQNKPIKMFVPYYLQRTFIKFVRLINVLREINLIEMDYDTWVKERASLETREILDTPLINKTPKYFHYRYLSHPVNEYFFYKYEEFSKRRTHLFVVRKKLDNSLQVVEAPTKIGPLSLLIATDEIRKQFNKNCRLLIWRRVMGFEALRYHLVGFLGLNNLHFIYCWLNKERTEINLDSLNLGDSDNG